MNLDIIPIKFSRSRKFNNNIKFYNKIKMPKNNLSKEKIKFILQQINNIIGDWIIDEPKHWLWIHRRWPKDKYL